MEAKVEEEPEVEVQDDVWFEMASIAPKKWAGFGSELEVDEEKIEQSRPLITVEVHRLRTFFGGDCNFQDSDPNNPNMFASFASEDISVNPFIQSLEIDRGIQVKPPSVSAFTQTGFSFKRNKIVQHSTQSIADDNVDNVMKSKDMASFFKSTLPRLEKVLQQNEMVDLLFDDYKNFKAKRGHEMEFSTESLLLQEYQTYSDFRHTKGRTVTMMTFHPALEDVVVMALGENVTFDKRIESHSKVLMEPNFVVFWDLRDSSHPQIMLDAPSDVFSFMINPSDPHLVCGGCANGQVALWDLGRTYYELRARTQDRKKKNVTDSKDKKPAFLERLKDAAEKFSCPLIPTAGLSNLDQSHKNVVTCTTWIPPHVELAKNGQMFENTAGGRSVQFYSTAGDGSLKLWDIRAPKQGLDDNEAAGVDEDGSERAARDVIKVNPWAHLENNQWKYSAKFNLVDEDNAPMFVTLMSLCEMRPSDIIDIDVTAGVDINALLAKEASTGRGSKSKRKSAPKKQKKSLESEGNEDDIDAEIKIDKPNPDGEKNEDGDAVTEEAEAEKEETGMVNEDEDLMGTTKKPDVLVPLPNALSSFFVGSETGQIALVDWFKFKDGSINAEFGNKTCQNMYVQTYHDGAITSISRSPFYKDVLLVVGGGTISIWKENSPYPILQCGGSDLFYWRATWSNRRPAVFYIATREGLIAVWDLLDRSNGPVMTQQVSNVQLACIGLPKVASSASKTQFLAVADAEGVLYVLVLPRFYARPLPHEDEFMTELINREDKRLNSWAVEHEERNEKIQNVHNSWLSAKETKTVEQQDLEEIEQEDRLNAEYLEFLQFQKEVVEELKREEPTLPTEEENITDEFEALILEAQEQQALEDALEAEEDEDGEEEQIEIPPPAPPVS